MTVGWEEISLVVQAIEEDARQLEIDLALMPRCLVCRTDIVHLRVGVGTCGDARRNVLSRLLHSRHRPVT